MKFINLAVGLFFFVLGTNVFAIDQTSPPISQLINGDSQIVVLGDPDHLNENIRREVADLIQSTEVKKYGFNCLFLEWGKDSNPAFDDYITGKSDYEHSVMAERERLADLTGVGTYNLVPQFLLDAARAAHFHVFGVDAVAMSTIAIAARNSKFEFQSYSSTGEDEEAYAKAPSEVISKMVNDVLQVRNEFFNQEIGDHFLTSNCKKGVFLVGAYHTVNIDHGHAVTPIQELLKKAGYSWQVFPLR